MATGPGLVPLCWLAKESGATIYREGDGSVSGGLEHSMSVEASRDLGGPHCPGVEGQAGRSGGRGPGHRRSCFQSTGGLCRPGAGLRARQQRKEAWAAGSELCGTPGHQTDGDGSPGGELAVLSQLKGSGAGISALWKSQRPSGGGPCPVDPSSGSQLPPSSLWSQDSDLSQGPGIQTVT